jgi:hypothetical protein
MFLQIAFYLNPLVSLVIICFRISQFSAGRRFGNEFVINDSPACRVIGISVLDMPLTSLRSRVIGIFFCCLDLSVAPVSEILA